MGGTDIIWVAIWCRRLLFAGTQLYLLCTMEKETIYSVNGKLLFKEKPRTGKLLREHLLSSFMAWWKQQQ